MEGKDNRVNSRRGVRMFFFVWKLVVERELIFFGKVVYMKKVDFFKIFFGFLKIS